MVDQRANEDDALRKWKVQLEQYERMLAQPNCNYALPHVRRWIAEKQHLQAKIANAEGKRAREDAIPVPPNIDQTTPPAGPRSVGDPIDYPIRLEARTIRVDSPAGEQMQRTSSQDEPTSNVGAKSPPDVTKRPLHLAQSDKSANRPRDIELANAVELIRPKFEQAFNALRVSRKNSLHKRDWESAIRQVGITDQADLDALLSCRKAGPRRRSR